MPVIKVKKNQTILDIALQEYGDVGGAHYLVADNDLLGITDTLRLGQELSVRDAAINARVRARLAPFEIATGETARGDGIGFWYIEDDFIIS